MRSIRVHLADGTNFVTSINGTNEEIRQYYIGQTLNLGREEDRLVKVVDVEFLDNREE